MTKDYEIARALQERLVQCCIDFIRETGNKEISKVIFTADSLQTSAKAGSWQPCTDSTCELQCLLNDDIYTVSFSA